MNILITGGAGYLGSILCEALIAKLSHAKIFVIDNLSNVKNLNLNPEVIFSNIDLIDVTALEDYFKDNSFDLIIHLSGKIYVHESFLKPEDYDLNNTKATLNLLKACQKNKINKIIFASSSTVYKSKSDQEISELDALAPLNPYGQSKLDCEKLIIDSEFAFSGYIFRIFNMSGADLDYEKGQNSKECIHVIDRFSNQLLNSKDIVIYGNNLPTVDGTIVRDYIHVSDVAELFVKAVHKIKNENEVKIFNCGSGVGTSLKQIVTELEAVLNVEIAVTYKNHHVGDPLCLISDSCRAKAYFNWNVSRSSLRSIVQSAVIWSRKRAQSLSIF